MGMIDGWFYTYEGPRIGEEEDANFRYLTQLVEHLEFTKKEEFSIRNKLQKKVPYKKGMKEKTSFQYVWKKGEDVVKRKCFWD